MSKLSRFCANNGFAHLNPAHSASGSRTSTALNAAYTHKTSGPGMAWRYFAQEASAIDELYVLLDATTGTRANVTLECKIYNESGSTVPGSTARATSTATAYPSGDDMWIKFTFGTPYTPTVGEILWFVVYNVAGAPATDYAAILTNNAFAHQSGEEWGILSGWRQYTSTDGFSTGTAASGNIGVVKHANGVVVGYPITLSVTTPFASNTRRRGIIVKNLISDLTVDGMYFQSTSSVSGIEVYAGLGIAPGSATQSWATGTDTNEVTDETIGRKHFDTPYTMLAGTSYRWVITLGTAYTGPACLTIEDYSTYQSIFDALFSYTNICGSTIDDGAGGWTDDNSKCPRMGLLIGNQVAAAGYTGKMRAGL